MGFSGSRLSQDDHYRYSPWKRSPRSQCHLDHAGTPSRIRGWKRRNTMCFNRLDVPFNPGISRPTLWQLKIAMENDPVLDVIPCFTMCLTMFTMFYHVVSMFYPWLIHIFPCVLPCVYPLKVVCFGCLMSYQRVTSPQVQHTGGIGVLRGQPWFLHSEKGISMEFHGYPVIFLSTKFEDPKSPWFSSSVFTPGFKAFFLGDMLRFPRSLKGPTSSIFRSQTVCELENGHRNRGFSHLVDLSSSLCKCLPEGKYIRHRKCLVTTWRVIHRRSAAAAMRVGQWARHYTAPWLRSASSLGAENDWKQRKNRS